MKLNNMKLNSMILNNIQYNLLTTLKRFKIYSSPILIYSRPILSSRSPEAGILFNKIPKNNNFQGKPFHTPILGAIAEKRELEEFIEEQIQDKNNWNNWK